MRATATEKSVAISRPPSGRTGKGEAPPSHPTSAICLLSSLCFASAWSSACLCPSFSSATLLLFLVFSFFSFFFFSLSFPPSLPSPRWLLHQPTSSHVCVPDRLGTRQILVSIGEAAERGIVCQRTTAVAFATSCNNSVPPSPFPGQPDKPTSPRRYQEFWGCFFFSRQPLFLPSSLGRNELRRRAADATATEIEAAREPGRRGRPESVWLAPWPLRSHQHRSASKSFGSQAVGAHTGTRHSLAGPIHPRSRLVS